MDNMAINADRVPSMKIAIDNYTANVQMHLETIKGNKISVADGVYGEAQINTVNKYIEDTCTQINTIVKYFDDFRDKLDVVLKAYESKQASVTMGTVEDAKPAETSEMVTVNHME